MTQNTRRGRIGKTSRRSLAKESLLSQIDTLRKINNTDNDYAKYIKNKAIKREFNLLNYTERLITAKQKELDSINGRN